MQFSVNVINDGIKWNPPVGEMHGSVQGFSIIISFKKTLNLNRREWEVEYQ